LDDKTKIQQLERENADLRRSVDELAKSSKNLVRVTREMVAAYKNKQPLERQAAPQTYGDYITRGTFDPEVAAALNKANESLELADELNGRLDRLSLRLGAVEGRA
jgi:hypothetical protein